MLWLIIGVLIWTFVHWSKCLLPGLRSTLIERMGEEPYKSTFSVLLVSSVVLMVLGWRASDPHVAYAAPQWGYPATIVLMVPALILFAASGFATNIKRFLRHPQLTGFFLWAASHLLSNGERRSLILFGGLALWALLQIVLINRRDGAWTRPAAVPVSKDMIPVATGIAIYAVLFWLHPYFAGMPVM